MSKKSNYVLLNCPFCNGSAKLKNMKKLTYYVECSKCSASTGMSMVENEAVDAWNMRDGITYKK